MILNMTYIQSSIPDASTICRLLESTIEGKSNEPSFHLIEHSKVLQIATKLAENNAEQWRAEDAARNPNRTDAEVGRLKRTIDRLNERRVELINDLHDSFVEELRRTLRDKVEVAFVSPADLIDRISILCLRVCSLKGQIACGQSNLETRGLLNASVEDLTHEEAHLGWLLQSLNRGILKLRARRIAKIYQRK